MINYIKLPARKIENWKLLSSKIIKDKRIEVYRNGLVRPTIIILSYVVINIIILIDKNEMKGAEKISFVNHRDFPNLLLILLAFLYDSMII